LAGVTHPNPRKQFIDDLQRTISQSVANHESVVIIGDYNEALGKNANLMASICSKYDLFDVHTHFHGANADIPTYARGLT
jgi:exonuclease III